MAQQFDFVPSIEQQNIEIPIISGLSTLHAEFIIEAPADPPGRIVSILGLRGNLTGNGRRKRRPLHFNFTQGQDNQARFEAEITPQNTDGQERGPKMPFPGVHEVVVDWDSSTGVATATINNGRPFEIVGPATSPITNGFLYIGGHLSRPPAPGELPVYTPPLGCRMAGFVAFNGETVDDTGVGNGSDNGSSSSPSGPRPVDPLPPIPTIPPPPIVIPIPTPTPVPIPPPTPVKPPKPQSGNLTSLAPILRAVADQLESGGDIDVQSLLFPVLQQLVVSMGGENAALFAILLQLLSQRLK